MTESPIIHILYFNPTQNHNKKCVQKRVQFLAKNV
jgi:hypothetical protein